MYWGFALEDSTFVPNHDTCYHWSSLSVGCSSQLVLSIPPSPSLLLPLSLTFVACRCHETTSKNQLGRWGQIEIYTVFLLLSKTLLEALHLLKDRGATWIRNRCLSPKLHINVAQGFLTFGIPTFHQCPHLITQQSVYQHNFYCSRQGSTQHIFRAKNK